MGALGACALAILWYMGSYAGLMVDARALMACVTALTVSTASGATALDSGVLPMGCLTNQWMMSSRFSVGMSSVRTNPCFVIACK